MKPALDSSTTDEKKLVAAARQGDYEAFEQLVDRHERRIYNLAMRIVRQTHDAEDVVQTTFLKALEHLDTFRDDAPFGHWVAKIASNTALKLLRKKRGLATISDDNAEDDPLPLPERIADWRTDLEQTIERRELRRVLDEAIDELEEKYRLVFVLRDVEAMNVRETAEALGISESNVKVRLLRARLMLREKLTAMFGDPSRQYDRPDDHHHVFDAQTSDRTGEAR